MERVLGCAPRHHGQAAGRLLALPGADRVALEQAARDTAGSPDGGRALGLLGRVAMLRALL
jgi:hypothetical protein